MDIWKILELEPTTDKDLIKRSYMEKLNIYHPEEDPEGFQMLRNAYEKALKYNEDNDKLDNSLEGQFLKELSDLYNDFKRRIDISNWQQLIINSDYIRIVTEEKIIDKALEFFMDNYFIPKSVWVFLIEAFNLKELKNDLYKKFHRNFINYILDFEQKDDFIRYEYFEVDNSINYDELISLCHKLNRQYSDYDDQKINDLIEQIDAFGVFHIDIEILKNRNLFILKDFDKLEVKVNDLFRKYPNDHEVLNELGYFYMETGRYDEALETFKKVLICYPNNNYALRGMSDCYFDSGDYVNAKEGYKADILRNPNNLYIKQKFEETNKKLVLFYEDIIENNKNCIVNGKELSNYSIMYGLAAAYYNIANFQKCYEILETLNPDESNIAKYYDILSDVYLQLGKYSEAWETIEKWKQVSDPTETMFLTQANTLMYFKRYDEAIEVCKEAIKIYKKDVEFYCIQMSAYLAQKNYSKVIETGEEGLLFSKNPAYIYTLLAEVYYELNQYADAIDACNNALDLYPYILNMFIIKLKIFLDVEDYDQIQEVINICDSYEIESSEILYYKSFLLRNNDEYLEAKDTLLSAIKLNEEDPKYYYELSRTYFGLDDYKNAIQSIEKSMSLKPENPFSYMLLAKYLRLDEQYDKSLEYYNIALEKNPESSSFGYCERGSLHESMGDRIKAKEDYLKSIEASPETSRAYGNLADLYRDEKQFEKAIELYTKQFEIVESPYLLVCRGICYGEIKETEKEIQDYNQAIEIDPSYAWPYNNLGYVYYKVYKDADKALEYYKTAIEKNKTIFNSYIYLADIYIDKGQLETAVDIIKTAIENFNDEDDKAYFYKKLGQIYYDTPETKKSIEYYEKTLELKDDESMSQVYHNLAQCYLDDKQFVKAEQLLKKAIIKFPGYGSLYSTLEKLEFVVRKRYRKALEYLTNYEEYFSNKAWLNLELGRIYNKMLKSDKAKHHLLKSIELYKNALKQEEFNCNYVRLAECYYEMNLIDLSLENYNKSLEIFNENPGCARTNCDEAFFGLSKIYLLKNDKDKALEYLQKAIEINADIEYQLAYEQLTKKEEDTFINKLFSVFNNKKN